MGRRFRQFNRWLRRRKRPAYRPMTIPTARPLERQSSETSTRTPDRPSGDSATRPLARPGSDAHRRTTEVGRSARKPKNSRTASARVDRNGRRVPRKFIFFVMMTIMIAGFAASYYRFDRRILPMVLEAAEMRLQTEINNVINSVVQEIIREHHITAGDFLIQGQSMSDGNPVLSVNTVLANEICNAAAQRISERLNNLEPEIVSVPIGMALGLDTLAQVGPRFSFALAPIGNALVNYESNFTAVGINQTHFTVWLTVESVVRIIKVMCSIHNINYRILLMLRATIQQTMLAVNDKAHGLTHQ